MLFIFILQRAGLVRIDVRLPSGVLAAKQALNNSENQQRERVIHRSACRGRDVSLLTRGGKLPLRPGVRVWPEEDFRSSYWACISHFRPADRLWWANSARRSLFLSLLIYRTIWWLASVLCTRLPLFPFIKHTQAAFSGVGEFNNEYAKCFSAVSLQEGSIALQTCKAEREKENIFLVS